MQTAAISYRVADFLRQFPPFQLMEEPEVLGLTARGRVKFHESDEFVCWQGKPHGPYVFVIQQGTVSLWEDTEDGERLRDVRGPGDMIGIERFSGAKVSPYSAKSASDVVIYALPAADLEPLLEKYPQASRYVAAHAGLSAGYHAADQRRGIDTLFVLEGGRLQDAVTCTLETSIREAARRMHQAGEDAIAVLDAERGVVGVLTQNEIVRWVVTGAGDVDTVRVSAVLPGGVAATTVAANVPLVECALAMARSRVDAVVITADGTALGKVHAVVTAADLAPAFGDHPSAMIREIRWAADKRTLDWLHQRVRAFVLEHLQSPASVEWLSSFVDLADTAMLRRLCELAGVSLDGLCLCVAGASGRRELLTAAMPRVCVIARYEADVEAAVQLRRVLLEGLGDCSYLPASSEQEKEDRSGSLEGLRQQFREWVSDPLGSRIYLALEWFDLRPVLGDRDIWQELDRTVRREISENPAFLPLLANDCLGNLPPLTFFEDMVVEESGEQTDVFRLKHSALGPLVDVGRVFGLAAGGGLAGSTSERLRMAKSVWPEHQPVFRDAIETLRVVLYQQARLGIRSQTDGSELPPSLLSRHDRQVLKACFRSILRLLEFTANREWL